MGHKSLHPAGVGEPTSLGVAAYFRTYVLVREQTMEVIPIGEGLVEVGLETIGEYITRLHTGVVQ